VDPLQEEQEAAEVMAGMGTTPEEQLRILMTIQRRQVPLQPLVVFPEEEDGGEYLMTPEDLPRGINPYISNIRTPVTPV
jgi:hypothetical protein